MGRGRATLVRCAGCGRNVSRTRAVMDYRKTKYSTELRDPSLDVTFMGTTKLYYCISCGKSLGVFERKKKQNQYQRDKKKGLIDKKKPQY